MKKKISIMLILVIVLPAISIPVFAKGDNGFYADDEVALEKSIGTTTFAAGNNVEISSEIDGSTFVAGNNIKLSSTQDYIYAAGNSITIENATTKDAFLAGSNISIKDSSIRDLYATAETIKIKSNIDRNAYLSGKKITINSTIDGDVKVAAEEINIGKDAVITGTLEYDRDAKLNVAEGAQIAKKKTYRSKDLNLTPFSIFKIKAFATLYSFAAMLIIGIILLALCKKTRTTIEKLDKKASTILKGLLIGFIALIVLPITAILILLTIIGLPLSILLLIFYGLIIYLSSLTTAYYVGNWFLKDKLKNKYLLLTMSLLILYLLKLIPVVGGFVALASLLFGMGLFFIIIKENIKEKK